MNGVNALTGSLQLLWPAQRIDRFTPENLSPDDEFLFESAYSYETRDVYLKSFGLARVSPNSVVYKGVQVVAETVVTNDHLTYYRFKHLVNRLLTATGVMLPKGKKYLLVTDEWSAGHFHWFSEVLPKLLLIETRARDFVLLLPDTPYVRKIGIESVEMLGIEFEDVVWLRNDEFYKVPNLYFITRMSPSGRVSDDLMQQLNGRFRGERASGSKRFYVSRSEAPIRKLLNESELEHVLKAYGFETLRPESLSLREQIDMFAECETLIGIHGAGLTNCLFMSANGQVVELRKREPNYGYWHLADSLGHKYYYYHGVPDSELSLIGQGCNLTIDVDDFESRLLRPLVEGHFDQ